jgi:hypothetical protein
VGPSAQSSPAAIVSCPGIPRTNAATAWKQS